MLFCKRDTTSHGSCYEEHCPLGLDAMEIARTFLRNVGIGYFNFFEPGVEYRYE
jgi:hypothetical protein